MGLKCCFYFTNTQNTVTCIIVLLIKSHNMNSTHHAHWALYHLYVLLKSETIKFKLAVEEEDLFFETDLKG